MARPSILYVSGCLPLADGSGSQRRAHIAANALLALGDVHLLVAPPTGHAVTAAALGEEARRYVSVTHMDDVCRGNPALWTPTFRPPAARKTISCAWVTAGMLVPLRRDEGAALAALVAARTGRAAFDLIYAFQSHAALFALAVQSRMQPAGGRFVVDWDAAERPGVMLQSRMRGPQSPLRRAKAWWNDRKLARLEAQLVGRASLTLCASAIDKAYFEGLKQGGAVAVVPNCIALPQEPAPPLDPAVARPRHVLFVGTLNYWPNEAGVLDFHRDVWPEVRKAFPDAVFDIVGLGVPPSIAALDGRDGMVVHGPVPQLKPYYDACDVAVAPMPFSVGSAIKILEALAFRRPLVGYEVSTIRHGLRDGEHVAVARTAAEFAARLTGLLADPRGAQALAERGYVLVREHFGSSRIESDLARLLTDHLAGAA